MPLLFILVFVTTFSLLPALITVTRKASEGKLMRRDVEQAGGKFIPTHKLWYLGAIEKSKCDFHVVYDGRIISVKVISLFPQRTFLNFIDSTSYEIKILGKSDSINKTNVTYSKKSKKPYNFKYKIPDEYNSLPKARVILLNTPAPARITKTKNGVRVVLPAGESTGEGAVYKTGSFVSLFKQSHKTDR